MNKYRLYTWQELADHPNKKFQREDWVRGYLRFDNRGQLWVYNLSGAMRYKPEIKDWKLKWREYVE